MNLRATTLLVTTILACTAPAASRAADDPQDKIRSVVTQVVQPVMAHYGIPGMAVGVIVGGKSYVLNYGVASTKTRTPVTNTTLFELGSVSKTFTATLASEAQVSGHLSLSDPADKYLPSLQNSEFGKVSLVALGTHTAGGLPLQVPDNVHTPDQLTQYFKEWRPTYAPGTYRTYSNLSIGTLGVITARSMGQDFSELMEQRLFPALGMNSSYIKIPAARLNDYAQGYTTEGAPIRVAPGLLSSEAYGIKTTAADMVRFIEANMGLIPLDQKLQRAITDTHTGYFKAGVMTQDLIWEQYPYPVTLKKLLDGNSSAMIFNATPVTAIVPPQAPQKDAWINKTGSTNGFGAYVAYVPGQRVGIVILANKNFPIDERVTAAYRILTTLTDGQH
ncbi:beta-lactamase class C [Paraburkholderia phenazinium]|uniref:Beta-lactamase n=1 Tax=Paraburkholderia phenazinium TaxID=60549 RepID=A0A1G7TNA4_9BURK|nr:class C beta-lactamase [Paraburkholderia phenazinium]SDG36808.1 beta-lactamase class C [Paraburkholderia phenazinium]